MKLLPAIDLLGGRVVCLVGGEEGTQTVSETDPLAARQRWTEAGARSLHVIDLDAAFGRPANAAWVRKLLTGTSLDVQVGGGVRSTERANELFEAGAARVIVGTRGVQDPAWLGELAGSYPDRVVLAMDVRDGRVATHGWREESTTAAFDLLERVQDVPLAAVLVTCIEREGRLGGVDVEQVGRYRRRTEHVLQVAGGIATIEDLRALQRIGADAAILGAVLYHGRFRLEDAIRAIGNEVQA